LALGGDEIRRRLGEFASRWAGYRGSERAGAQSFLDELLRCYGVDRMAVGARFEERARGGFVDMVWPAVCIVEMKRPSEVKKLDAHRDQAFDYWKSIGRPGAPAPPFVVLCAFHRFVVYKPDEGWDAPRVDFELAELPEHLEALAFLVGRHPSFESQTALTRDAVVRVTDLYHLLEERLHEDVDSVRDFVLQCVWTMFAEDLGMLGGRTFQDRLDDLVADARRSTADDLGQLFRWLATPGGAPAHGLYAGTPYADGGLFETPAKLHLERDEVALLREAASFDWARVEPAIFGALLEGTLGPERQWALGAHYTSEADILKCVLPTVIEPWRERVGNLETMAELEAAERDLMRYVVLDPACGSGNFLYVAYRNLRRIEVELRERGRQIRARAGVKPPERPAYFPLSNMRGIEIEAFAVRLARVTLWMGHKLAVDELGLGEEVLPLADLSGIWNRDALEVAWPRADAIVGNPPYHGSQQIRRELGDAYAEWLKAKFDVGLKDYCVYWFRKAHDVLSDGGRAGLVGTNSISQNRGRGASLEYIVRNGGVITNAVSTQDWSGAAAVDVSIVNWVKSPRQPPRITVLDGVEAKGITSALRSTEKDVAQAHRLNLNRGRAFQGPMPVGMGFVLTSSEAEELLARDDASYDDVVRPYLVGEDILREPQQRPTRYIVDFGLRPLEEAAHYPAALAVLRKRVKAEREHNADRFRREHWWLLGRPVLSMRQALLPLSRYIASSRIGKRIQFVWCDSTWLAGDRNNVFAFENDYAMGVLSSGVHTEWARAQSSTFEDRINYTPTSAFETFPWPTPTPDQREAIADLARRVVARRQEICLERQIGLTKLYNEIDDGAYRDLAKLHRELDEAVAAAYGWPKRAAHDPEESNRRLLELNRRIVAGEVEYAPFD
jgi:hypothetical protein